MSVMAVTPQTHDSTHTAEEPALTLPASKLCDFDVNEQPGIASPCKMLDDKIHEEAEAATTPPTSPNTSVEEPAVMSPVIKPYTHTSTPSLSSPIMAAFASAVCPSTPSSTPPRAKAQPQRHVTFSPDIVHPTGRRPRFFCRLSKAYRRGRYACPEVGEWFDTSFKHGGVYLDEEEVESDDDDEEDEEGGGEGESDEETEEEEEVRSLLPPSLRRRGREEFEEDGEGERVETKRRCAPNRTRLWCYVAEPRADLGIEYGGGREDGRDLGLHVFLDHLDVVLAVWSPAISFAVAIDAALGVET